MRKSYTVKNHMNFGGQSDQGSTSSSIPCQLYDSEQLTLTFWVSIFSSINLGQEYLSHKANMKMKYNYPYI